MDWAAQVDAYCERTDLSFWSEPLNAVTNLGYLLVALWFLRAMKGVPLGRGLALLLLAVAVGSFLFHTLASNWAGMADSLPIGLFILLYLYALNRVVLGWPVWAAGAGVVAYLPYAVGIVWLANLVPFLAVSNFYWSVPVLMAVYAGALRRRVPGMARALAIAAALLCVSISIRSVDLLLCETWPLGTHFLWHLVNAGMFIVVLGGYRAHVLAAQTARR